MFPRWMLVALLAIAAIHSASYGAGFVADPAGMVHEFGAVETPSEAAQNLTGLVGVLMLLLAAAAALAAYWIARFACQEGILLAWAIAIVMVAIGVYWAFVGHAWDAGFYTIFGVSLAATGVWLHRRVSVEDAG